MAVMQVITFCADREVITEMLAESGFYKKNFDVSLQVI